MKIDNWLPEFIEGFSKDATETKKEEIRSEVNQENKSERREAAAERNKDIRAFEVILEKHPEILDKLKAQGIDLNAERDREREKLKQENPGMSEGEIESRSALAVYLRHQDAIVAAAPDDSVRKELDAGFDRLRSHARDAGIPYQETIRNAAGILPTDKAAIMMATSATLDTRVIRV